MRLTQLPEVQEFAPGHNNPPEPIEAASLTHDATAWAEYMARVLAPTRKRLAELKTQFDKMRAEFPLERPIGTAAPKGIERWDDQVQGRFGDLRSEFLGQMKIIDAIHTQEKEPVLRAGKAIDGAKNSLVAEIAILDGSRKLIPGQNAPLNWIRDHCTWYAEWKAAESRREAAEEAERKRQEADAAMALAAKTDAPEAMERVAEAFEQAEQAEAAAVAPVAQHSRVHGAYGSVTSLKTRWAFVEAESNLHDLVKAAAADPTLLRYLSFNSVVIGQAVRSEKLRELPGCEIREVRSV